MPDAALLEGIIDLPQPMHEEDVIGAECAIDEQLATPMTVRMLLSEKIFLGAADCRSQLRIIRREGGLRLRARCRQRNEIRGRRRHGRLKRPALPLPRACP